MPTYEYLCNECAHQYEVFEKTITKKHPEKCPECGSKDFGQYLGTPLGLVYGNPTTFGQQAEINARRMGKEQMQKMKEADDVRMKESKWTGKTPPGTKPVKKFQGIPFYRQGMADPSKPLDVKKVKDINKYIATGDMN